jgi:phage baseplate assembly protein gpV
MIDELLDRLARLEQRMATLNPVGKVVQRDHDKGVRVQLGGTDDNPMLSPWIQPGDWSGTTRFLPDIGQQVMVHSHGGDWTQASLIPLTHSDDDAEPGRGYRHDGVLQPEQTSRTRRRPARSR